MVEESIISKKSFDFAIKIIGLYKLLLDKKEYVISKQLLRCGTSIGANVREAGAGQTAKDFIAKMSIASKEARETDYWLSLLKQSKFFDIDYSEYINDCSELIRILTSIVKTMQQKQNQETPKPPKNS